MIRPRKRKRELVQMSQGDLKSFREKLHHAQAGICPLTGLAHPIEDMVVDHKHRNKSTPIGENGAGLIRGVIQFQANSLEGKISNGFVRYGLHKLGVTLVDYLRNLADYLERAPFPYIHPTEKPKELLLQKSCYIRLCKEIRTNNPSKKIPLYPSSGKLTKPLELLFQQYNIPVTYYGKNKTRSSE